MGVTNYHCRILDCQFTTSDLSQTGSQTSLNGALELVSGSFPPGDSWSVKLTESVIDLLQLSNFFVLCYGDDEGDDTYELPLKDHYHDGCYSQLNVFGQEDYLRIPAIISDYQHYGCSLDVWEDQGWSILDPEPEWVYENLSGYVVDDITFMDQLCEYIDTIKTYQGVFLDTQVLWGADNANINVVLFKLTFSEYPTANPNWQVDNRWFDWAYYIPIFYQGNDPNADFIIEKGA